MQIFEDFPQNHGGDGGVLESAIIEAFTAVSGRINRRQFQHRHISGFLIVRPVDMRLIGFTGLALASVFGVSISG
jgi:hypothetical protein